MPWRACQHAGSAAGLEVYIMADDIERFVEAKQRLTHVVASGEEDDDIYDHDA